MTKQSLLFLALLLLPCFAKAQMAEDVEIVRQRFSYRTLRYDLILRNRAESPLVLDRVAFEYTAYPPDFLPIIIGAEDFTLKTSAQYIVPLEIRVTPRFQTVIQSADPPLILEPGRMVRLSVGMETTLSLADNFHMDMGPVLYFDNGRSMKCRRVALAASDIREATQPMPTDQEVLQWLSSGPGADLRAGFHWLPKSTIPRAQASQLLSPYMTDQTDPMVRVGAIEAAGRGQFEEYSSFIARVLEGSQEKGEIIACVEALMQLDPDRARQIVVARLGQARTFGEYEGLAIMAGRGQYTETIGTLFRQLLRTDGAPIGSKHATALMLMGDRQVPAMADEILRRQQSWLRGTQEEQGRFAELTAITIHYAFEPSLWAVKSLLQLDALVPGTLSNLERVAEEIPESGLPYVRLLRQVYPSFLGHSNVSVRTAALSLVCLTEDNPTLVERAVAGGLKDTQSYVRTKAAGWAGRLQLTRLAPLLQALAQQTTEATEREVYCNALRQMGRSCTP